MVLGVRGIPNVQGGIETHAEQLYPLLAKQGCEIELLARSRFVDRTVRAFRGVGIRRLWCPSTSGYEAFVHSFLGVIYAAINRPHILHVHGIGPSIVTPLARLLRLRVVVTNHGPDYEREKWGAFARWILRVGERWGALWASGYIAISQSIADRIASSYEKKSVLIPNGVGAPAIATSTDRVRELGLIPGHYWLQVGRMVPEKRQLDSIAAFKKTGLDSWHLALVGMLDEGRYSRAVVAAASGSNVVLTGFMHGEPLAQLFSHAAGFLLPSSHEGLPIALLEALSYGLPVLASDIPPNLEVGLAPQSYFSLGDTDGLAARMIAIAKGVDSSAARDARKRFVAQRYDWNVVAQQTLDVYSSVLDSSASVRIQ